MKRFLLFFVVALLFVACDNKFEDEGNTIQGVSNLPTLTAEFADEDTRTYVEDNFYLRWHEGDLISAFLGNTLNNKYIFKGDTGDNGGTFSAVSSTELGSSYPLDNIFALYPYDEDNEISKAGVISCSLPAVQEYAEESFGKGANTMVAVTKSSDDTFLAFKNACGYLKVKLYGKATVKSIELRGNNGEKIAGEASITATYGGAPTVAMAEDATESITLNCGEGVKLSTDAEKPTEFWFVVPPTEFSDGLTIVATDTNGVTFVKSTSNAVTITRNEIQPMAALGTIFRDPTKPAYNEIWYTSSDGEIVGPRKTNVFGANIVSNNYKDGKGVITFDGNVTTIGAYAFCDCRSLTSVTIGDSVTTIGHSAFFYCTSLTSVTIGDSVTTIGNYAFLDCDRLTSVTIPDSVTTIGDYAFYGCDRLTSVTIPDSVTTIGDTAFAYCRRLTSVTIPDSVTTIGEGAFNGCRSLTSVTIPDSVTTIGDDAFSGCDSLKEFKGKFASDNGRCLIVDGVLNSFAIGCGATDYTIPDSVTTIGNWAFYDCKSLTSITIGDSVTTIGNWAFYDCKSLTSAYCEATTPPSLGDSAFNYYSNGVSINIGCTIYVPRGCGSAYKSAPNWSNYAADIVEYDFETGEVVPEGQPKNEIWYTAEEKVVPYYDDEFGATLLSNTYNSTTKEGVLTFDSDVTKIGDKAFYSCDSLTSVTIPDSVTTIGNSAFYSCDSLTSVTIGDSVTTIGDGAFASCSSLTSVTIGDSVTTIGGHAFWDCSSLTSVTIPDSVTTIGYEAFYSCDSLTSVTIPDSVTTIGEGAFKGCTSLKSVYCKATTPPSLGGYTFYDNHSDRKIYVPRGCGEAYKSATSWSNYAADIVEYDF